MTSPDAPLHARIDIVNGQHHISINGQPFADVEDFVAATNLLASQAAQHGRSVHVELPARGKIASKFFHIDVDGSISKTAAPVALAGSTAPRDAEYPRSGGTPERSVSAPRAPATAPPSDARRHYAWAKVIAPVALTMATIATLVLSTSLRADLATAQQQAESRQALYLLAPQDPTAALAQARQRSAPARREAVHAAFDEHLTALGYRAEITAASPPQSSEGSVLYTQVGAATDSPARFLADLLRLPFDVQVREVIADKTRITVTVGTRAAPDLTAPR